MNGAIRTVLAAASLIVATSCTAGTPRFVVNNQSDDVDADLTDGLCRTSNGSCTLRAAVMQANQEGAQGALIVLPSGTFQIIRPPSGSDGDSVGDFNITNATGPITIQGAGKAATIIDANGFDRAFALVAGSSVSISGVTIKNGDVTSVDGSDGSGGAITMGSGTLYLTDTVVTSSKANYGGCLFVNGGNAYLKNVSINSCSALAYGGAVEVEFNALIKMESSTVADSTAAMGGGGIVVAASSAQLYSSTVSGNKSSKDGGGIYVGNPGPSILYAENSTIANNQTLTKGGGLVLINGFVSLPNSTVARNDAEGHDGSGYGGGYFADNSSTISISNSLFANNTEGSFTQDCEGGQLYVYGANRIAITTQCPHTLESGGTIAALTDSSTGPLQNNGGPTQTIALLAGSNAINAAADC